MKPYLLIPLLLAQLACSSAQPAPDEDKLVEQPVQPAQPDTSAAEALQALQGSWVGPWVIRTGDGSPDQQVPFEAKVEIAGDRFWLYAPYGEPLALQITLSPNFDPPFIDLADPNSPGEPLMGVYAFIDDTLLICTGKTRPNGVLPCDSPNQWLLTLTSQEKMP
jgi:uncharacterized protein (TIGR03067 family)